MDRVFRVDQNGQIRHVVERAGTFHEAIATGTDVLGGYTLGLPLPDGLQGARVLAPVRPSKIVCVGLNYKDHAAEVKKPLPAEPLLFIKPSTSVIDPGTAIRLPPGVGRVDYEGELAIVIGRRAHRVSAAHAWNYIFGLTCLNDVTARDLQNQESQYTRCKGFDSFAPLGPCVAVGTGAAAARTIETKVNGQIRQSSSTAQLIFGVEHLVEFITFVMTLEPGDIISTGTPSGIGSLAHGDVVAVAVEGIGALVNPVEAESV